MSLGKWAGLVLLVVIMGACGGERTLRPGDDSTSPTQPGAPVSIRVNGPIAPLSVGGTYVMSVTALDASGHSVTPPPMTWVSSDTLVATVSGAGVVQAVGAGSTVINARSGGLTASATVAVQPTQMALDVLPLGEFGDTIQLSPGQTIQLTPYYHQAQDPYLIAPPPAPVTWTSSGPELVAVSGSGLVTALEVGNAEIRATVQQLTAKLVIRTVSTPGTATVRFVHTAQSIGGLTLRPNAGSPITISGGDVIERTVPAGTLQVTVDGLSPGGPSYDPNWLGVRQFTGFLAPNTHATIIILNNGDYTAFTGPVVLAPLWDFDMPVAPDSATVRVVLATPGGYNVFFVEPGRPATALALRGCYLDWPYGVNAYSTRVALPFDIVLLGGKALTGPEAGRLNVIPQPGRAMTYIITGNPFPGFEVFPLVDR